MTYLVEVNQFTKLEMEELTKINYTYVLKSISVI